VLSRCCFVYNFKLTIFGKRRVYYESTQAFGELRRFLQSIFLHKPEIFLSCTEGKQLRVVFFLYQIEICLKMFKFIRKKYFKYTIFQVLAIFQIQNFSNHNNFSTVQNVPVSSLI
jgi:hypothetical protein